MIQGAFMSELWHQRAVLCDMLTGRTFRIKAAELLAQALYFEGRGAPALVVDETLGHAAHYEWIASISEQGKVLWGGRFNRDGQNAELEFKRP